MYHRLKQMTQVGQPTQPTQAVSNDIESETYIHENPDNEDNEDNEHNGDDRGDTNTTTDIKNKILNNLHFFFNNIKSSFMHGLSNSWFLTSVMGIYAKYYLTYKLSKKTQEDYNNMIKGITIKMSEKNIFFTKIFQAFANSNNLVDNELFHHFVTYTDNVKYDISEINYNGLYDLINIARNNGDDLCIDSEIPIKSGNIALVYTGKLNGQNIIIKYRRNNIIEKFNKSMNELNLLVNICEKIPYVCDLNIKDLFEENREIMTKQLDFLNEVANIELFRDKFKDVKTICIPNVYSYFTETNPCVIIMEKLEGKRIEHILPCDKYEYSKILSKFNLKCVFYDSIYHADLHSGNIIFMKDDYIIDESSYTSPGLRIGIIDYGIIGTMTREEQNVFFMFFKILVSRDHIELAKFIVESLSENIVPVNAKTCDNESIKEEILIALVNDISVVCGRVLSVDSKFFGGEEIYEINKILRTHNLQFSKFFCRVELAIAISENVCNSLATNSSYIEQMMIAFNDIFGDGIEDM
jgi:predicted unusual protein kinase regulating ubiquinone biosynthesis (AarF/ABC1/UbiB family)